MDNLEENKEEERKLCEEIIQGKNTSRRERGEKGVEEKEREEERIKG